MVRFAARWFLLIFPGVFAASAFAQTAAPHVEPASHRAAHASPFVPLPQQLFGAIPLSTRSEEARKTLELAWDKYENAMYQPSAQLTRQAAKKDPHSALSYALVSFAARRGMPDAAALAKAKALLSRATPDERLLVRWMTDIQDDNLLPAIASMRSEEHTSELQSPYDLVCRLLLEKKKKKKKKTNNTKRYKTVTR